MRILGIHDGHNASVCLVEDGVINFAIQEERLVNEKNKSGFPSKSIERLFSVTGLRAKDIDKLAFASSHTSALFATGEYFKKHEKGVLRQSLESTAKKTPLYTMYKNKRRKQRIESAVQAGFPEDKIEFVDHHLCHAATAYYGSHFPRDEEVLVLTNDGAGDGICATVSVGHQNQLKKIASVDSSNSLAGVYCLITKMLGFKPLEHEYKLMGMAPYSSEFGRNKGYEIFDNLITISDNKLLFERQVDEPISRIIPLLQKKSNFVRFDWVCAGLQKFTEEMMVNWVRNCIQETGIRKIALAGGIFMNVKANQKIMELPEVEDIFVFPSCGDETISIGAAYHLYSAGNSEPAVAPLSHFYLGDIFSDEDVLAAIKKVDGQFGFSFRYVENIEKEIASLLAQKKVVARCKGAMEFGARALGNRSILADPSTMSCVREINMMVKKRDFWMPFAPVMLKERASDYIMNPKNIAAPYMIICFDTTNKYKEMIAAVHQADLTARPQIVDEEMNRDYYAVLKEFEQQTGRGVLLNTSFNLHGYPIVHGPTEALDVFRNSGLKYLAVGNYLVEKGGTNAND